MTGGRMATLRERIIHRIHWLFLRLRRRIKSWILLQWQRFFPLPLPHNHDGRVWLHLGCGELDIPGFINVDARPAPHVHLVGDVGDLSRFADGSVDLVYGSHVLEHIPRPRIAATLWEWRRVLKPGGILRLSVPDFQKIIELYLRSGHNVETIQAPLFGQQDYRENAHLAAFDEPWLRQLLLAAGFTTVRPWHPDEGTIPMIPDCSSLKIDCAGEKIFISLNLEAIR